MGRSFAISTPTNTVDLAPVALAGKPKGEVTLTVTNRAGRPLRGTARLCPIEPTRPEWVKIVDGEAERAFEKDGTHQYKVCIEVPTDTAPGKYTFRMDFVSSENPDEDSTAGPAVTIKVAAAGTEGKKFPYWILAVVGVVLIGLGVGAWLIFRDKGEEPVAEAEVPDVVSKTVEEAQKLILDAGLAGVIGESKASEGAKPGTVVDQAPKKGEKLAKGKEVTIFPVKEAPAADLVDIPGDVVGKDLPAAKLILFEKGLAPKVGTPKFTGKKPGIVLDTAPKVGQKVPRGSTVELVAEKDSIQVPLVVRWNVVDAVQELSRRTLMPELIEEVNAAVPVHSVLRQEPQTGYLEANSKVKLWVAQQPVKVIIPHRTLELAPLRAETLHALGKFVEVPKNYVNRVRLNPGSPGTLSTGAVVHVTCGYGTEHGNRAYVTVKAMSGVKLVSQGTNVYCDPKGSGDAAVSFGVYATAGAEVDALVVEMVGPDKKVIASHTEKVQYRFLPRNTAIFRLPR